MTELAKPKRKARASFMEVNSNPFETNKDTGETKGTTLEAPPEFESLADTVKIERLDFDNIMTVLEEEGGNELRIKTLHIMKIPYLFTSDQLITILHVTPSIKTRISFIEEIGPRLLDPKAKSTQIIDMFRYSEEKKQVERVLKARAQTVTKQATFSRGKGTSQRMLSSGTGGRGRGGGGRGGGKGGRGSASVSHPSSTPSSVSPVSSTRGTEKFSPSTEITSMSPVWTPAPRRESFVSPVVLMPLEGAGNGKGTSIPMKKRFSNRPSQVQHAASLLNSIGDMVKEEIFEENEDGDEEIVMTAINGYDDDGESSDQVNNHTASTHSSSLTSSSALSSLVTAPQVTLLPQTTARCEKLVAKRDPSFCATTSVMTALGFADLENLTTDDIGMESWDVKAARNSSVKSSGDSISPINADAIAAANLIDSATLCVNSSGDSDFESHFVSTSEDQKKEDTTAIVIANEHSTSRMEVKVEKVKEKVVVEKDVYQHDNSTAKKNSKCVIM